MNRSVYGMALYALGNVTFAFLERGWWIPFLICSVGAGLLTFPKDLGK